MMNRKVVPAALVACLGVVLLIACGGGGKGSPADPVDDGTTPPVVTPPAQDPPVTTPPTTPPAPPAALGTVTGNVVQAGSVTVSGGIASVGTPVPSVKLFLRGAPLSTSNEQGFFSADLAAGAAVPICFEAPGFVRTCENVDVVEAATVVLPEVELIPAGPAQTLAGGSGTATNGTAQAALPPGTICKLDRSTPIAGDISCRLTPIDASDPAQRARAPGDYTGTDSSGQTVQLVSGGMLDVTCTEVGTGERVNVCQGKSAQIRIPITSNCANDATYPNPMTSWSFNESTGRWAQEASLAKTCVGATGWYEGAATHFSFWNADLVTETTCLRGRTVDGNGQPVSSVRIACDGTDYQGSSQAYSRADGTFCVAVKRAGAYSCTAAKGSFRSSPIAGIAPAAAAACGSAGCADLGSLVIAQPAARAVLTWGAQPEDLDTHLVGAGTHVFYGAMGSLSSAPFISLDTDDTSSFGPEVLTMLPAVAAGTYRYCVNDFDRGPTPIASSGARVVLVAGGVQKSYAVPAGAGNVWRVAELTVGAGGSVTVRDLNSLAIAATTSSTDVAAACNQ